jgi:FtsH-binding integral membrane protein
MGYSFAGERAIDSPSLRVEIQPLMRLVYLWMGFGLLVTTLVSVVVSNTPALLQLVLNPAILIVAIIAEIGLVIAIAAGIRRWSANTAAILFCVYAGINGFTLSVIFLIYAQSSIIAAFATTVGLFGVMSVIGYTTKTDLTKMGSFLMMALIGLVIAMVVNIFLRSGGLEWIISIVGVLVFTGLSAYDTQKIKLLASDPAIAADNNLLVKMAILGALTLYLDFINLFLFLLRLFGSSRD